MTVDIEKIKQLRQITGSGVMDCRSVLEEANGNIKIAEEILQKRGFAKAAKKEGREIKDGLVHAYIHQNGKIGVLVKVGCETDFVARNEEFKDFCHEIAMQIAALNPQNIEKLLEMEYIRDSSKTIKDLLTGVIAKFGENVGVEEFVRFEV